MTPWMYRRRSDSYLNSSPRCCSDNPVQIHPDEGPSLYSRSRYRSSDHSHDNLPPDLDPQFLQHRNQTNLHTHLGTSIPLPPAIPIPIASVSANAQPAEGNPARSYRPPSSLLSPPAVLNRPVSSLTEDENDLTLRGFRYTGRTSMFSVTPKLNVGAGVRILLSIDPSEVRGGCSVRGCGGRG